MTDRTPASPVEVLAPDTRSAFEAVAERLEESATLPPRPTQYRRGWAEAHRLAAEAVRAALQAQDHTITKGGLREALHASRYLCNGKPHAGWKVLSRCDHLAADLRAALEPTHD